MSEKKISELVSLTGANAATGDLLPIVDVDATETKKITREEFFKSIPSVDINGGTIDGTVIGGSTPAAISGTTITGTGGVSISTTSGGINYKANTRTFVGSLHSTHFAMIGSAAKADETANSRMIATETSTGNGLPSAIQLGAGNIDFHTLASSTADAAFNNKRMRIDKNGDISFYEDTGTTPKFFWDASAEALGIGTSSPSNSAKLDAAGAVIATSSSLGSFNANNTGFDYITSTKVGRFFATSTDTTGGVMTFTTGQNGSYAERMRIDSSGNVGIGTSSPAGRLDIRGGSSATGVQSYFSADAGYSDPAAANTAFSGGTKQVFWNDAVSPQKLSMGMDANASMWWANLGIQAGGFNWYTSQSGAGSPNLVMRIDSSGDVSISGTSGYTASGVKLTVEQPSGEFGSGNPTQRWAYAQYGFSDLYMDVNANPVFNTDPQSNWASTATMIWQYRGTERMRITSAGNVGIGTSSVATNFRQEIVGLAGSNTGPASSGTTQDVSAVMRIRPGGGFTAALDIGQGGGNGSWLQSTDTTNLATNYPLLLNPNGGNVGIGTSSPSSLLDVEKSQDAETNIELTNTNAGSNAQVRTKYTTDGGLFTVGKTSDAHAFGGDAYLYNVDNTNIRFATNDTERMRLDASGNLLVGNTTGALGTAGVSLRGDWIRAVRDGDIALQLNRLTSNGDILEFRKDGSTVGSIGTHANIYTYIGTDDTALLFAGNIDAVMPFSPAASNYIDDTLDLGTLSYRFDDIYATNGTIQTSDRNEKQDIEELSEAERRVAVAAKGLLRKFRWKSAVEEKGDDARIHFGIIAQDLQAAFEAEGLDAGRYAMFIHSTWTDEETGEEKSRMGVRYSELLAFIIAAI